MFGSFSECAGFSDYNEVKVPLHGTPRSSCLSTKEALTNASYRLDDLVG